MTKEYFLKIYQEYLSSGLSKLQFCLENDYGRTSFYNWEKQWCKQINQGYLPTEIETSSRQLVPITILPEENTSVVVREPQLKSRNISKESKSKIEISLPSGAQIKLTGEIEHDLLLSILNRL